ncbi:hypothetical protein HMF8227_00255 [Saliniradius amylolyticus]|uniref:RNA polymerase sigma factor FecI n=1 Tax=Saliniradius amylolyticus TaxID=2183582 RepID=A0A2S2DZI0_9ALTE|nr:RNA polymerase sigma factor [Saliniradius amylolyticus]AWL10763.1 hypothetical protein HMF8227_00255 [Saliniradius amylolyticus]
MKASDDSEAGAEGWYESLVLNTHNKLKRALGRMLSAAEADEVIQESYLKLFEVCKEAVPENPQGYVYRIARNFALTRLRNKEVARKFLEQRVEDIEVVSGDSQSFESVKAKQQHEQLQSVISQLPPVCRQVFVLRKLHGYSHREIAETMQISQKTVENHIARGMRACFDAFRRPSQTSPDSAKYQQYR